ncbi:MAG TPA: GNAT family N-acetyltransferase [Solirubrobacteraceae bacterium]|jgi:ribosomal protein S18 acetylase RimI-like enzyme|nr:GNAT family N-acetyltransferase [Solirubrobacteraceae bacterium]
MLERAHGLTITALEAIEGLERRVVTNDGGRLKLEWGALRTRPVDGVRDLLWWEDGRLLGFLGIYSHGWPALELAGMVDPGARRRGIGRKLFDAALTICRANGAERLLLVVPRASLAGREFAASRGLAYEHSEHAMTLRARPAEGSTDPTLRLREATPDDIADLSRLFADGFGSARVDNGKPLVDDRSRTLMIERDGETVGTVCDVREGGRGAVYGFVVASEWRGRGIGRDALRRVADELFDAGAAHVDLEVETANDRALGLYTSVGFSQVATDDYYEVKLA